MAMAMKTLVDVGDNWLLLCEVKPLVAARLPSLPSAAFRHFIKSSCGQTYNMTLLTDSDFPKYFHF